MDHANGGAQAQHVATEWSADAWVGDTFVGFNLVVQVIPCVILLANGAVDIPKGGSPLPPCLGTLSYLASTAASTFVCWHAKHNRVPLSACLSLNCTPYTLPTLLLISFSA